MYDAQPLELALGYAPPRFSTPVTRSIRMLFKDRSTLEPYVEHKKSLAKRYAERRKEKEMNESQLRIFKLIQKGKPVTGASAAKFTGWTQNHCSMVLTSLYKMNKIRRRKESGNNTRWYVYTKLEEAK